MAQSAYATAVPQYTDKYSGADKNLSCFFDPSTPVYIDGKELTERIGQRPQSGYPDTSFVLVLRMDQDGDSVPIKGGADWWDLVWSDKGSGVSNYDFCVWQVKPARIPAGYVCVSPCFFKSRGSWVPPSDADVKGMVAVSERLVKYVPGSQLIKVWDDKGSKASSSVSIYTGPDNLGLFGFPTYTPPLASASFPVLAFQNYDPPPTGATFPVLGTSNLGIPT